MNLHVESRILWDKVLKETKNKIAMDIGANTGGYAAQMLDAGFEVWAYEPVNDVRQKMEERLKGRHGLTVRRVAISDERGVISNVNVQSCWTLVPDGSGLERAAEYVGKPPFNVITSTIDHECDQLMIVPGFIKLDVDGYEFKALRGGVRTIQTYRPPILCEFNCYINKLGQSPEEFVRFITETLNYRIESMDGEVVACSWEAVAPHWPYHSPYDVMLLPN
jgi:FkbM family methyltransferase